MNLSLARLARPSLLLLAAACVEAEPDPAVPLGTDDSALLCDGEDWRDFTTFASDAQHRIGAQYGMAVASLPGCSGALVTPTRLITANHCYRGDVTTATFGVGWSGAEQHVRNRLTDLGLTATEALYVAREPGTVWSFTCTRTSNYSTDGWGNVDVDVYDCAPVSIDGLGRVAPGDLWGHLETHMGERSEGTRGYVLSVNKASAYSTSRILLSPEAYVIDSSDGCKSYEPWEDPIDYEHCFEHDGDQLEGSSGGPILDANHRLFGLVQGHMSAGITADVCDGGLWSDDANYGAYVPSNAWATGFDVGDRLPSVVNYTTTVWAGGTTGSLSSLPCPSDSLAIGVVGTTYPHDPVGNARVGNFGLVCGRYARSNEAIDRTSARWEVLFGGSYDTALGAGWRSFNAYIHEVLDLQHDGGAPTGHGQQQQSLTVCRPGYYLTGVQVHGSSYLDRVVKIECERFDHLMTYSRVPRAPIGTRSSTLQYLRCPNDSAVTQLRIRAGWLTDAIQLGCRSF